MVYAYAEAAQFGASVNDAMEDVFSSVDGIECDNDGTLFTNLERKKAWLIINGNIAKVVGPILKQYTFKRGRWTTDVWDFGHPTVVYCLYNARRGGLVAQFDLKKEVQRYHSEALAERKAKDNKDRLRERAFKILKANGFTDADLLAMEL